MAVTLLPPVPCPVCGATLDAHGDADGTAQPPAPGDYSVCAYCATILIFDAAVRPRVLTAEELAAITPDHEVRRVQQYFQFRITAGRN